MKQLRLTIAGLILMVTSALAQKSLETAGTANAITADAPSSERLGIGLILGEPTGLSAKYYFTETVALDGAVGWSFHHETDLHLHADALWHTHDLFDASEGRGSLYYGVGGRVKFRHRAEDRVGVRVPVGVSFKFDRAPVDLFVEVAPVLDVAPSSRGSFTAGIGARFWF